MERPAPSADSAAGADPADGLDHETLRRLSVIERRLVSRLDLEGVLDTALVAAAEISGARYAALGILDRRKRSLKRFLTYGIDDVTRRRIGDLPTGGGLLGELIAKPDSLRVENIAEHPGSSGFPSGHPPMSTFLGVPIVVRGEPWGNFYLTEKAGGEPFDERDEQAVVTLADWTSVAIENARLYEGLARRSDEVEAQRDQAEHHLRAFEAMADVSRTVGGETRLERILELIVGRGRDLIDAGSLLVFLHTDQGGLQLASAAGDAADLEPGAPFEAAGPVIKSALETGASHRLVSRRDLATEGLDVLAVGAESGLVVPLAFRGKVSGILVALDRQVDGPDFAPEDERLLRFFAVSAATAVTTAKSVEVDRLRHSIEAAEMERRRWARELHDQTLQALGGLRMLLSAAIRGDTERDRVLPALRESVGLIDEEIENLSTMIVELRPAALDQIGLEPALMTLAERRAKRHGIAIDVLVRLDQDAGEKALTPELESLVYRLVQEALTNVEKHAGATRVEAIVRSEAGEMLVTVHDDGRGFDPEAARGAGFGIVGMRERIAMAGGSLEIESVPGEGTTVAARIPVTRQLSSSP